MNMSHSTLKQLLKEYEQKRSFALSDLENRKEELYRSCPRLQEIDTNLNQFAFHTVKSILSSTNKSSSLEDLKSKIASLKLEKNAILKDLKLDDSFFQSNISNLRNHTFDQFLLDAYSTQINEDLYHSNLSPRDNIQNIKEIAFSFITHFDDFEEKNLLFTGNTGLR